MTSEELVLRVLRDGRIEFTSHGEFRSSLVLLSREGIITIVKKEPLHTRESRHRVYFDVTSELTIQIGSEYGSYIELCSRFILDMSDNEIAKMRSL